MTDPIENLIAAAQHAHDVYRDDSPVYRVDESMAKLLKAIAAAKAAAEARPEPKPDPMARDWTEDFARENGNYSVLCSICKQWFLGYKRRVACRVCANALRPEPAADSVNAADQLARLRAILERVRPLETKAHPAPWSYWPGYGISPYPGCTISFDDMDCDYNEDEGGEEPPAPPDTAIVIAARNAIAEMLRVPGGQP